MNRLFHRRDPGLADYAGLVLFAVAYLAAVTLILAPGAVTGTPRPAEALAAE